MFELWVGSVVLRAFSVLSLSSPSVREIVEGSISQGELYKPSVADAFVGPGKDCARSEGGGAVRRTALGGNG